MITVHLDSTSTMKNEILWATSISETNQKNASMVEVPNKKELKTLTLSKEHDWRPQTGLDDLGHGHKLNIIAKKIS